MNKWVIFIISVILFQETSPFSTMLWAGNQEHVEKRVEDLDRMNKNIVQGFSHIPQYGTIEYKAHVQDGKNGPKVKITEKNIEMWPKNDIKDASPPNNAVTNK